MPLAQGHRRHLLAGVGSMALVSHVEGRALKAHDVSPPVSDGAAACLHPADLAVGARDAVVEHVGIARLDAPPDELFDDDPVVGVEAFEVGLVRGDEAVEVDAEDAEHLVGPRHPVGVDVPLPAPEARQALRLGQQAFVFEQRLSDNPAFGDVARDLGEPSQVAVVVVEGGDDDGRPEAGAVPTHAPALGLHATVLLGVGQLGIADAGPCPPRCRRSRSGGR